ARGARLVEHGAHGDVAPAEAGRPDLLALEGEQYQFAQFIAQPYGRNAAVEAKRARLERVGFDQRSFGASEHTLLQENRGGHGEVLTWSMNALCYIVAPVGANRQIELMRQ